MKYFGEKSVSSVVSGILKVSWYVILAGSIVGAFFLTINLFSISLGDPLTAVISGKNFMMDGKENTDWEAFRNMPPYIKILVFPYFIAFVVFLLKIIKKSQELFTNFRKDIVFNKGNALIISKISKLNIWFALLTFNFGSLLVSVVLFMLCEIFKSGAALQEEHDYTV